ncbi:MAG: hypothetical protein LAT82_00760 [Nanoarchaeota archaeon]|nr:hypothetical protein [Nanoarchaeota archaeon]
MTQFFKTKINKVFLSIGLIMMIFIAGCVEGSGSNNRSGGQMEQFRGGASFVEYSLEPGSPPQVVYDAGTTPFDIILKVENKGEWDIEPNSFRVMLEGFSDSQRWGNSTLTNFVIANQLIGYDSLYNIDGDFEYISFTNLEYKDELNQNSFTHNYIIRACHPYGTKVAFTACVDNEARRSLRDGDLRLCDGFSNREFSVSSGPIGVSQIEQQIVNGRLRLIFTIDHRMPNNEELTLFAPGSMNEMCRVQEGVSQTQVRNAVQLSLVDSVVGEFSCSGEGKVTFPSGVTQRRVTCETDISNLEQQEVPMLLNIEYDILKNMRNSIRVERSN